MASNPSFVYRGVRRVKEEGRHEDPGAPSDPDEWALPGLWQLTSFSLWSAFSVSGLSPDAVLPMPHCPRLEAGADEGALWLGIIARSRKRLMVFMYF